MDTDGDGLTDVDEMAVYGTSPVLADTDGDGLTDRDEIVAMAFDPTNAPLLFNPRIADVPLLELRLVGAPLVSFIVTDTKGETRTFGTIRTQEEAFTVTESRTETNGLSRTVGEALTREDAVTVERSPDERGDAGAPDAQVIETELIDSGLGPELGVIAPADPGGPVLVALTNAVAETVERSTTEEIVVSFTQEQSRQLRQSLTLAETYAQSHDVATSGGIVGILMELVNRGNLAIRVTELLPAAAFVSRDGTELPVGNLDINTNNNQFTPWSLAPGERQGPVNFISTVLTLEQMSRLVDDLTGLVIRPGVYELSDANGKPYAFDAAVVRTRTATVSIDYGESREPERHLVATNLDPAQPGVSLKRTFEEILHLPFECDADAGGITSVHGHGAAEGGGGKWCLHHRRNQTADEDTEPHCTGPTSYDCTKINLRAGDVLRLFWVP